MAIVAAPDAPASEPTITNDSLVSAITGRLTSTTIPLKFTEIVKGMSKPEGVSPAVFRQSAAQILDDEFRVGRAYRYPSGAKGVERFWSRDEKQVLRDAALTAASPPKTFSTLKAATGKAIKGTDGGFVEAVLRDLIGNDRLFEYPSSGKAGGLKYGAVPPPPPATGLALPKFQKRLDTVAKSAEKLIADADVSVEELLAAVRTKLSPTDVAAPPEPARPVASVPELEAIILKAVAEAGPGSVLSLADLRAEMPTEFRGPAFNAAVLALAGAGRVRIYQDADPLRFSPEERARLVADTHGHVFSTIARRGDA